MHEKSSAPERRRARRPYATTVGANLLIAGLNAATGVFLARSLGPHGRGILAAIQTWPGFFASIAMLGLPEAVAYFCASDRRRAGQHLSSAVLLALTASAVLMAVGWLIMPYVLAAQGRETVQAARMYLLLAPILALVGLPLQALRGRSEYGWWNAIRVAPVLAWFGIVLWSSVSQQTNPVRLSHLYLAASGLVLVPVVMIVAAKVPGPFRPDLSLGRPLLRYGLPSAGSTLPQMLNLRLDQLLMAAFLPTRQLGLYVAAVAWSSAVSPILSASGSILLPSVAGQQDPDSRRQALCRGSRMAALVAIITTVPVLIITPLAMRLVFGSHFHSAIPAAVVLVVAAGVVGWAFVLEEGLRGLGRPALVLHGEMLGLLATGAALGLFLPAFGIMGAAIASLVGYVALASALAVLGSKAAGCTASELWRPRREEALELVQVGRRLLHRGRELMRR